MTFDGADRAFRIDMVSEYRDLHDGSSCSRECVMKVEGAYRQHLNLQVNVMLASSKPWALVRPASGLGMSERGVSFVYRSRGLRSVMKARLGGGSEGRASNFTRQHEARKGMCGGEGGVCVICRLKGSKEQYRLDVSRRRSLVEKSWPDSLRCSRLRDAS